MGVRKRELVGVFRYLLALPRALGPDTAVGGLRDAIEGANGGTVTAETVQGDWGAGRIDLPQAERVAKRFAVPIRPPSCERVRGRCYVPFWPLRAGHRN